MPDRNTARPGGRSLIHVGGQHTGKHARATDQKFTSRLQNPCRGTDELGQGFLATDVAYKRCHGYLQTYIPK
jgi:hypothetical protein